MEIVFKPNFKTISARQYRSVASVDVIQALKSMTCTSGSCVPRQKASFIENSANNWRIPMIRRLEVWSRRHGVSSLGVFSQEPFANDILESGCLYMHISNCHLPVSIKTTKLDGGKVSNTFDRSPGVDSSSAGATYPHRSHFHFVDFFLTRAFGGSGCKFLLK